VAPYLVIANNAVENALRPVAVGRKDWLHLGSDRGGRTGAVPMSLVQSCRRLGNEPFA
jgi:transposase